MLERLVDQLVKELSLGSVPPEDELKMRHLKVGQLMISLKELDPGVYFFSKIAPVPPQKKEELFMYLMKANFLGQGTGEGVIGLTEDESFLTLSLALPYELSYLVFKEALEEFANFVDYWRREVEAHK